MFVESRALSMLTRPWWWFAWCLLVSAGWMAQAEAADSKVAFALTTRPEKCTFSLMNTEGKTVQTGSSPFIGKVPVGRYRLVVQCPSHLKEARVLNIRKATVLMVAPFPVPRGSTPAKTPAPRRTVEPRKAATPTRKAPPVSRVAPQKRGAPQRFAPPVRKSATPPLSAKKIQKSTTTDLKRRRPIPWIAIATGGGLLIAGAVFFILSQNSLSYADDKNNFQLMAYREYLTARDHRSTSFFLLIAGGVALAISGVMYFWGWPSKRKGRKFYDPPRARMQGLFPTVGLSAPPSSRTP